MNAPASPAPAAPTDEEFLAPSSRRRFQAFLRTWRRVRKAKPGSGGGTGRLAGKVEWHEENTSRSDHATRRRWLRRYYAWLKPWWPHLAGLVVLGFAATAFDLAMPLLTGLALDLATSNAAALARFPEAMRGWSLGALIATASGVALLSVAVSRFLSLLRDWAQRGLIQRITLRLRREVWRKIMHLEISDLQEMKSGGAASRVSGDVDGTVGLVQQAVLSPVQSGLRLALVAALMLWMSWPVALTALLLLGGVGVAYWMWISGVRPIYRSMGDDKQRIDARISEALQGVRVVRSFARESREEHDHAVGQHTQARKWIYAQMLQSWLWLMWDLLLPTVAVVSIGLGAWLVSRGTLSVGQVLAFQMLIMQALGPVLQLVGSATETQRALAAMERVYEVLDRPDEKPDPTLCRPIPGPQASLRFEAVSFAYGCEAHQAGASAAMTGERKPVLDGVSITFAPGTVTALVGPSGSGKSTFADLMARFHDPSIGAIRLGDIDIRDLRLADYRRLFGIVAQDVFLFDGTVADNLRYARRDASLADLEAAAARANALEFIRELPRGFDAVVGERGVKLSGGQRQRLSIARAILADPRFLILDEATSNLDTASEQLIQAALSDLLRSGHRTTLVIAHRLSTIRNADQIVVLERGRVAAVGDHSTLMQRGPGTAYHDMVRRQELSGGATDAWSEAPPKG